LSSKSSKGFALMGIIEYWKIGKLGPVLRIGKDTAI
jgi:hypothetical protein